MRKTPHPTDRHVGSRIRMRRMMLSMSQEKLGDALGITFQQVQKNEKGANRIGASRLQQIAEILRVPVSFFFEGQAGNGDLAAMQSENMVEVASPSLVSDFLSTNDSLSIVRDFNRIPNAKTRRKIVELIHQIAGEE